MEKAWVGPTALTLQGSLKTSQRGKASMHQPLAPEASENSTSGALAPALLPPIPPPPVPDIPPSPAGDYRAPFPPSSQRRFCLENQYSWAGDPKSWCILSGQAFLPQAGSSGGKGRVTSGPEEGEASKAPRTQN